MQQQSDPPIKRKGSVAVNDSSVFASPSAELYDPEFSSEAGQHWYLIHRRDWTRQGDLRKTGWVLVAADKSHGGRLASSGSS